MAVRDVSSTLTTARGLFWPGPRTVSRRWLARRSVRGVSSRAPGAPRGWLAAAVVSGVPLTVHAVATGRDPLAATRAAGSLLVGEDAPAPAQLAAAVPVHLALSWFWATALERALPARDRVVWGAVGGLAIAALDLGAIGRRRRAIRRLPLVPQLADHVLFGAVVGALAPK